MNTVREAIDWAKAQLSMHENALLEAQIILAYVMGCDRTRLMTWPDEECVSSQLKHYKQLVERRVQYEPMGYLTGEKEFWSRMFYVTKDVLVPRADTETLIEVALEVLPNTALTLCDVGTGSGVIACTLALERPNWQVLAFDLSEKALDVAKLNVNNLNIQNVQCLQSDWLSALNEEKVDVIVSNPPYLREEDPHLEKELTYEPRMALVAGKTGLEAIEKIIQDSTKSLKPGGKLILEHGWDQASDTKKLFEKYGFSSITTHSDLSNHPRVTLATFLKEL